MLLWNGYEPKLRTSTYFSKCFSFPGCDYSNVPGTNALTNGGWGGEMTGYVSILLKVLCCYNTVAVRAAVSGYYTRGHTGKTMWSFFRCVIQCFKCVLPLSLASRVNFLYYSLQNATPNNITPHLKFHWNPLSLLINVSSPKHSYKCTK